jgi:hypothetical protein
MSLHEIRVHGRLIGTFISPTQAADACEYISPTQAPKIFKREVVLSDFVDLIKAREECDTETAIYEAVLTHNLALTNECIYQCYADYCIEMDEDARKHLLT